MVGVRSSGFFADNTFPVNALGERHAKSTLMGQNRESVVTPIVKAKLKGPGRLLNT